MLTSKNTLKRTPTAFGVAFCPSKTKSSLSSTKIFLILDGVICKLQSVGMRCFRLVDFVVFLVGFFDCFFDVLDVFLEVGFVFSSIPSVSSNHCSMISLL